MEKGDICMGFLLNGQLNTGIYALRDGDYNALVGVETATGYLF